MWQVKFITDKNCNFLELFQLSDYRGVARIFHGGEGVVTLCQSEDAHVIVMPPVLGCLLKRALSRYLANL